MAKIVYLPKSLKLFLGLVLLLGRPGAAKEPDQLYQKLDVFAQVLQYVQNGYVEERESQQLVYGAIRGMLKTLDPHSSFMTPEEFKSMQEDTSGHFGGVGIELELRHGRLIVVAPIDDTPAARAGILSGDQILKIDGNPTKKMEVAQAARLVKGVPGTKVVLTILRDTFSEPKDFVLIRQRIRLNPVEKSMPLPGYGYVKIRSFQERTERYLSNALADLKKKSGGSLKGLILDLRNNPGGLLDQAIRVADRFIPEGVIVETRGRGNKVEKDHSHRKGTEPFYPMICLINGGSASASEIVAGALQDHGRALIMGTRSFGKGSVQTVVSLKDGSGLKLTIARYYTPNLRSIQEAGIKPDVVVGKKPPKVSLDDPMMREMDLDGHLVNEASPSDQTESTKELNDYPLQTALHYLKAWERFGVRFPKAMDKQGQTGKK